MKCGLKKISAFKGEWGGGEQCSKLFCWISRVFLYGKPLEIHPKICKTVQYSPKICFKIPQEKCSKSMYQMTWHFLCIYFVFHSLHNGQTFLEVKRGLASMEAIWPWLNKNQIKFTKRLLILDHLVRVEFAYFAPSLVII